MDMKRGIEPVREMRGVESRQIPPSALNTSQASPGLKHFYLREVYYLQLTGTSKKAPITDHEGNITQPGDESFFATAIRKHDEEFAIPTSSIESIKVLSLNVEYSTLSVDVITLVKVDLEAEEIKQNWLLRARHRDEASKFGLVSTKLADVVNKLFTSTLWHPSARMRLIQFLFHAYGIDEVAKAIKEKRGALGN